MDENTAASELESGGVAGRRTSMGAAAPGTGGRRRPQPRMAGRARAPGSRSFAGGPTTWSFWLLLVLYPLALPLGTYPVLFLGRSVGAEFLFALPCAVVVVLEIVVGRLKAAPGNPYFLLGLALWLGANVVSLQEHPELGTTRIVLSLVFKAMLAYTVFWVLEVNGRLEVLLKSYLAGCALSGLAAIALLVETGDLNVIRLGTYGNLDYDAASVDVFSGFARAGAGNLLPVWICAFLYPGVPKQWKRAGLLAIVWFMVLAMLALRREVLVEAVVGLAVLWLWMPRGFRPALVAFSLALGGVLIGTIALSEHWQERLVSETREQFEQGDDPRTVMLLKTLTELMEAPVFGHGPGSYPVRMTKHVTSMQDFSLIGQGIGAHNSFSRAAVETGVVGLSGFCLMVAALGWRAVRRRSEAASAGLNLRLAAVMILLHLGDMMFFGDGISTNIVWLFMGVLLYLDRCLPRTDSRGIAPARQMMKPRRGMTTGVSP